MQTILVIGLMTISLVSCTKKDSLPEICKKIARCQVLELCKKGGGCSKQQTSAIEEQIDLTCADPNILDKVEKILKTEKAAVEALFESCK